MFKKLPGWSSQNDKRELVARKGMPVSVSPKPSVDKRSQKPSKNPAPKIVRQRVAAVSDGQLLYSREQVCHLLGGVHRATVVRMEESGRLRPVRLNPGKPTAKVFYRRDDVLALIEG
jgi:hypothetical protein